MCSILFKKRGHSFENNIKIDCAADKFYYKFHNNFKRSLVRIMNVTYLDNLNKNKDVRYGIFEA